MCLAQGYEICDSELRLSGGLGLRVLDCGVSGFRI